MWFKIKAFLAGVSVAVLKALGVWLKTEAAEFCAEFLPAAMAACKRAAEQSHATPKEKFDLARTLLLAELKRQDAQYRDHWVDGAIQTAYSTVKAEWEKAHPIAK